MFKNKGKNVLNELDEIVDRLDEIQKSLPPDPFDITIVLDRSGSMEPLRSVTIERFNAFIAEQQKVPGSCAVSMVQFDHEMISIYSEAPIGTISKMTLDMFQPRGTTALFDAIGESIKAAEDRPGKHIVMILTDGLENSSKKWKWDALCKLIHEKRTLADWQFIFLGTSEDAIATATKIGIQSVNAAVYTGSLVGTRSAWNAMNSNVASYRATGQSVAMDFSADQREAMLEE